MNWCTLQYLANRRPATLWQWLNPVWWLSDEERNPAWPWWRWWLRNPFANLWAVIVGVQHLPRVVVTTYPGNFAARGWVFAWTLADGRWLPLPYASFRCRWFEWACGWKTHGGFSPITLRRANAPNAGPTP